MNPEQWLSLKWNGGSTMSDRWLNQSKIIQLHGKNILNITMIMKNTNKLALFFKIKFILFPSKHTTIIKTLLNNIHANTDPYVGNVISNYPSFSLRFLFYTSILVPVHL